MHVKILLSTSVVWKYLQTYDKKKVVLQSSPTLRNRLIKQPLLSYTKALKNPDAENPHLSVRNFFHLHALKNTLALTLHGTPASRKQSLERVT